MKVEGVCRAKSQESRVGDAEYVCRPGKSESEFESESMGYAQRESDGRKTMKKKDEEIKERNKRNKPWLNELIRRSRRR